MRFSTILALAFATVVSCNPVDKFEWKRPGPQDRRGPCPMINSLANHGYIRRSGLNVSLEELIDGFVQSVNIDPESTRGIGLLALTTSTTGNNNTFHISDISKHGVIEHDGSLSRNDIFFGDNSNFNERIYNSVASFFKKDVISIETAAKARVARVVAARAANPQFTFGEAENGFSCVESGLYLRVFGNGILGNAKTKWVNTLFREQRIPFKEGFKKSATKITSEEIFAVGDKVCAAATVPA